MHCLIKSSKKITAAILVGMLSTSLLTGCSNRNMADVEYDASHSPYHRVKRNETLASIAKMYNIDKKELAKINGLKPPYRILVGQKLVVRTLNSKNNADEYDMPATEGAAVQTTGEVKANKLAPLPGVQDTAQAGNMTDNASFSQPAESQPTEPSEHESVAEAQPEKTEEERIVKTLPGTPKSASFYAWPVKGKVIKNFESGKKGNTGIKIAAPQGTAVKATNNGVVARAQQIQGYGKLVLVKHDNGMVSIYAHLDSIDVKRGDVISAGQKIGTVGKTGNVREPQLHFEIREKQGKVPVDPIKFLD